MPILYLPSKLPSIPSPLRLSAVINRRKTRDGMAIHASKGIYVQTRTWLAVVQACREWMQAKGKVETMDSPFLGSTFQGTPLDS